MADAFGKNTARTLFDPSLASSARADYIDDVSKNRKTWIDLRKARSIEVSGYEA